MNKQRLLQLARFLETLKESDFKFSDVVKCSENGCGSICCAIGWTPKVFPNLVKWTPVPNSQKLGLRLSSETFDNDYITISNKLFDITYNESRNLFSPNAPLAWWSNMNLGSLAKPHEVALSIRKFIEHKEMTEGYSV